MKQLLTIFTILFMVLMVLPYAEAKKFGGGKSFGKQHSSANVTKNSNHQNTNTSQAKTSEKTQNNKGFMGGMLGGLLAGGLLGSLFSGGLGGLGGGGGSLISILILAILGFAIFKAIKMIRGMNMNSTPSKEEYATDSYHTPINEPLNEQISERSSNIENKAVNYEQPPHTEESQINLPPNFNVKSCVTDACRHYRLIQQSWDKNDFSKIKEYVASNLIEDLRAERSSIIETQHTTILYVNAEIIGADYNEDSAQLSIKFFGKYKEQDNIEKDIDDIWHLERNLTINNSPWLIVGIQ